MHCGLHKTAEIFNEELRERSTPLPQEKVESPNSKAFEVLNLVFIFTFAQFLKTIVFLEKITSVL